MANDRDEGGFDLSGTFDQLLEFETRLDDITGITMPQMADAMAGAFEAAGERIETALSRAARTGQLDFEQMVTGILAELARLAAHAVFDQFTSAFSGGAPQNPPVSFNITLPEGGDAGSLLAAQGQIASVLGQAVLSGGRWS